MGMLLKTYNGYKHNSWLDNDSIVSIGPHICINSIYFYICVALKRNKLIPLLLERHLFIFTFYESLKKAYPFIVSVNLDM